MKISVLVGVVATAALATAVATPSSGQPYGYYGRDPCQSRQHDSGTTGAIVGGLAGALLGSSVAPHHGNRAGGAAIGGIAGALLGNSIGRSSAKSSDICQERDYESSYYGYSAPSRGGTTTLAIVRTVGAMSSPPDPPIHPMVTPAMTTTMIERTSDHASAPQLSGAVAVGERAFPMS